MVVSSRKLSIILENKVSQKLKLSKNTFSKKCAPRLIIFLDLKMKKNRNILMIFEKTDFESQILALFDNFLVNLQNETILFENTY